MQSIAEARVFCHQEVKTGPKGPINVQLLREKHQSDMIYDKTAREKKADMWHTLPVTVNGYTYDARYSEEAYRDVLRPLLERLADLQAVANGRTVVYFAGPPAAGKSTVALLLELLSRDVPGCEVQAVGLDGFHHYNAYLRSHTIVRDGTEMPLAAIKGAPESFDVEKFARAVTLLHEDATVPWPVYDRTIHDPRENAVQVTAPIVVVEGNYLLLAEEPWASLAPLADYTVFLSADEADLRERAVTRKAKGGISRAEAEAHYDRTDGPNIRRALEHSRAADFTMRLASDGDLRPVPAV